MKELHLEPHIDCDRRGSLCTMSGDGLGFVDRFYQELKSSQVDPHRWVENLPVLLLGIRATVKTNLGCSSADLVLDQHFVFRVNLLSQQQKSYITPHPLSNPHSSADLHIYTMIFCIVSMFLYVTTVRASLQPPNWVPF